MQHVYYMPVHDIRYLVIAGNKIEMNCLYRDKFLSFEFVGFVLKVERIEPFEQRVVNTELDVRLVPNGCC